MEGRRLKTFLSRARLALVTALILAIGWTIYERNTTARSLGFTSAADMKAAKDSGFDSASAWREHLKIREASAKEKSERKRVHDEKFKAGFILATMIRDGMKNPDAFNLEQAVRTDAGDWCFKYRSTNSFNAVVPGYTVVTGGKSASDSDRGFQSLWKKHCSVAGESFDTIGPTLKGYAAKD